MNPEAIASATIKNDGIPFVYCISPTSHINKFGKACGKHVDTQNVYQLTKRHSGFHTANVFALNLFLLKTCINKYELSY